MGETTLTSDLFTLVVTQLPVVLFGLAIALLPSLRRSGLLSRLALAWLAGATLMCILAPLLSLAGVWGERSIAIPLIAAAVATPIAARRRAHAARLLPEPQPPVWSPLTVSVTLVALVILAHAIVSGRALAPDVLGYDIGKAAKWAEDGMDPSVFSLADPAEAPLQSVVIMWTEMLQRDSAAGALLWSPLLLMLVFVAIARAPAGRLIGQHNTALTLTVTILAMSQSIIAAQAVGSSVAWFMILAPLALMIGSSPGTPVVYLACIASAVTLSHRAGIFLALALVLVELSRRQKRRATWAVAASVASILPWWILLAASGHAPWSGVLRAPSAEWRMSDTSLVVLATVSLLLMISRWRRRNHLIPTLALVAVMAGIALSHAPNAGSAALLALRLATPVLVCGACLLTLRPLRGSTDEVPLWRR